MAELLVLPASSRPDIVVIMIATRDAARLERSLRALVDAGSDGQAMQVVLCANAADADVLELVEAARGAIVMRSTVNLGTAVTWNRAVDAVDAPRFAIVHEDTYVAPGWLGPLARALDDDLTAGIAAPRMLNPDGSLLNEGYVQWRDQWPWPLAAASDPDYELLRAVTPVDVVNSAAVVVDRAAWDDVGGFDEGTFPGGTVDLDLGTAVRASGRRILTVPASSAVHDRNAVIASRVGWQATTGFRDFRYARNHSRFEQRWAAFLADLPPCPPEQPDAEAFRAARARALAAGSRRFEGAWPSRARELTHGLDPAWDAPPELEERASARLADLRLELTDWLLADREELLAHEADITERNRHAMVVLTSERARHQALVDEHAARARTLTWRARGRVLGFPGVAALRRSGRTK